jgi:prolyl 4-hydroxylase
VVRRIQNSARAGAGMISKWRPRQSSDIILDGFFDYHYDKDSIVAKGNPATTFMFYLASDCIGGGTNFPFLDIPGDTQWCDVIEYTDEGRDGFQGVTFKPRAGSAVFWENILPNGSTDARVYHAALPVKSGSKVGLDIWSWDSSWTSPEFPA